MQKIQKHLVKKDRLLSQSILSQMQKIRKHLPNPNSKLGSAWYMCVGGFDWMGLL